MIYICVICMIKRPPLLPLSSEHRKILEAIVFPAVNIKDLETCHMLLCSDCKMLMNSVYTFQKTALVGVKNLQSMLRQLNNKPAIEDAPVSIKEDPEDLLPCTALPKKPVLYLPEPTYSPQISIIEVKMEAPEHPNPLKEPLSSSTLSPEDGRTVGIESHIRWESHAKKYSIKPVTVQSEGKFDVFTHGPPKSKEVVTPSISKTLDQNGKERKRRKRGPRGPPMKCDLCAKTFCDKMGLREHKKRLHMEKPVKCDVCSKLCRNETVLKTHKKQRHNGRVQEIRTIDNLNPELFCAKCQIQFYTPSALKMHRMSLKHTPRDSWKFECETCHRKFPTQVRRLDHINSIHLNIKSYKCDQCDKSYIKRNGLRHHIIRQHDKQAVKRTPHMCDLCGKVFTVPKSLREHLLSHSGARPHSCPLCPATFTFKAALYTHNRLKHLKIKGKWKKKVKKKDDAKKNDAKKDDAKKDAVE